jgi:hypothetical protein
MKKFKFFFGAIIILGFLVSGRNSLADVAPDRPSCTQVDQRTGQPGCGFMDFYTQLDASVYRDRFVFLIKHSWDFNTYEVLQGLFERGGRDASTLVAVDKDYFNSQGGLNGVFNTKTISADSENSPNDTGTVYSMSPNDPKAFAAHSYLFVVSKDDKNLYIDSDHLIEGQYAEYWGNRKDQEYVATPNLSCTPETCSKILIYTPEAIKGNYILVAPNKEVFQPTNANKPAPYVSPEHPDYYGSSTQEQPSQQAIVNSSQNVVLPPQSKAEIPATIASSWWQRLWNAIKLFFKSIFK